MAETEKLVRLQSWVTPKQKAKVQAAVKRGRKRDPKLTESSIIRGLLDNHLK